MRLVVEATEPGQEQGFPGVAGVRATLADDASRSPDGMRYLAHHEHKTASVSEAAAIAVLAAP